MAILNQATRVSERPSGTDNGKLPAHPKSAAVRPETVIIGLLQPEKRTVENGGSEELHMTGMLKDNVATIRLQRYVRNSYWDGHSWSGYGKDDRRIDLTVATAELLIGELQKLIAECKASVK